MDELLIGKLRTWLGAGGVAFFRKMQKEHGRVDAVYSVEYGEGRTMPHSVHFREGMQVRNFLRGCDETLGWTSHDYDDRWVGLIEQAIRERE